MKLGEWLSGKWFKLVHGHNLVYNTCWEDPRLDRVALNLSANDTVLVITSAGCNVLDYALLEPRKIFAVDMNPRQNALLELKLAGIQSLDFDSFYAMFGQGRLANYPAVYKVRLRPLLSPAARKYWDRHRGYFSGKGLMPSFYFHGTAGTFARLMNWYIDRVARIREPVKAIFAAQSVEEQRAIYDAELRQALRRRGIRWAMGRDTTLSLIGVPRAQRLQVERGYDGGIAQFIEDCLESVFTALPLGENYFWRVYAFGEYTPECCPEYLKRENFEKLKAGLIDRVSIHTCSILHFLRQNRTPVSRFVLLDHMDWLSANHKKLLQQEWQAIADSAAPGARVLYRSGGLNVDYVDPIEVRLDGKRRRVGDLLQYHRALAEELHAKDRVHTYGSFYVADLLTA